MHEPAVHVDDDHIGEGLVSVAVVHAEATQRRRWLAWLAAEAPEARVVVAAESWLDVLSDPSFPVGVTLLQAVDDRIPLRAKVAALSSGGGSVYAVGPHLTLTAAEKALAAGARAILSTTARGSVLRSMLCDAGGERSAAALTRPESPEPRVRLAGRVALVRPHLSEQEQRVLVLYVSGYKLSTVARRIGVKYDTAKSYLDRVREKYDRLGRTGRTKLELYRCAVEDGWLDESSVLANDAGSGADALGPPR